MEPRDAFPRGPCAERPIPADSEEIKRKIESLRLVLVRKAEEASSDRGGDQGQQEAPADWPIEGSREIASAEGKCLIIEKDLKDCPSPDDLARAYRALEGSEDAPAGGLAFLDLETTGLSATPLFLAGMLVQRGGTFKAMQLLARDYSEERCLIGIIDQLLAESLVCVTFNGKSFDLPYLRERAKYHRLSLQATPRQFDLLHHARRRWRHHLPDCRLLTLEWYILGRRRMGDVGGWEVPCIYHEFVHTKNPKRLEGVLRHNLMDVLAMAELLVSLAEAR